MKVVVLQSNYLPWKGYFDLINDADVFVFYDEVQYTKNDWRNRNKIATKNGVEWLTIPISKAAVKQKISEVKLPEGWESEHFKKLYLCYKKAPFFKQLEPFLISFYQNKSWGTLSDFNQYSIKEISRFLNVQTRFYNSSSFKLEGNRVERLVNLLTQINATEYISGPSAASYLNGNEGLFEAKGIKLTYKKYPMYRQYTQFGPTFEPFISIVDLIAHVHQDEASTYIWPNSK